MNGLQHLHDPPRRAPVQVVDVQDDPVDARQRVPGLVCGLVPAVRAEPGRAGGVRQEIAIRAKSSRIRVITPSWLR
ncbi:MAG: hypothetical protein ABJB47_03235 [Actinomycetota bacterium]